MKYILCLACLAINLSAFTQISTDYIPTVDITNNNWITYVDHQEFKIEYKRTDCDQNFSGFDQQYFFVKISNKTQSEININWDMELFYNDVCRTCGVDEYQWHYKLNPLESVEGECTIGAENELRLFSKFIDVNYTNTSELTGFKFSNLFLD